MMPGFKEILTELKRYRQEVSLQTDDNMLFDGAVRIYNSMLINQSMSSKKDKSGDKKEIPMTPRQKEFLQELNYRGPLTLTKKEAAEIIRERLSKEDKNSR